MLHVLRGRGGWLLRYKNQRWYEYTGGRRRNKKAGEVGAGKRCTTRRLLPKIGRNAVRKVSLAEGTLFEMVFPAAAGADGIFRRFPDSETRRFGRPGRRQGCTLGRHPYGHQQNSGEDRGSLTRERNAAPDAGQRHPTTVLWMARMRTGWIF